MDLASVRQFILEDVRSDCCFAFTSFEFKYLSICYLLIAKSKTE